MVIHVRVYARRLTIHIHFTQAQPCRNYRYTPRSWPYTELRNGKKRDIDQSETSSHLTHLIYEYNACTEQTEIQQIHPYKAAVNRMQKVKCILCILHLHSIYVVSYTFQIIRCIHVLQYYPSHYWKTRRRIFCNTMNTSLLNFEICMYSSFMFVWNNKRIRDIHSIVETLLHYRLIGHLYYCISCYFREGFIFANFASQTLAKISTSIHVYL